MMTKKQEQEYVLNKMGLFFSVFAAACKIAIGEYDLFLLIAIVLIMLSFRRGRMILKESKNNL